MELSGYIAVVRRWWWTLLVAAWVAGLTGLIVATRIPPTYESRVQLLVGPINTDVNTLRASGQLVQTYAQLVTTEPLLDSAIKETGLDITAAELAPVVRATANDVTRILSIRVQAADKNHTATLANAIATELIQLASRGIGRPEGQLQIIEAAKVPTVAVAPQISILVLLAAAAGLIGALVIVLLIEYLSDSIRSREDLIRSSRGTPLGSIRTGGSEVLAMASGRAGQAYLLLAAKLILGHESRGSSSILIQDATTTRTASVVAANVAAAIGHLGRRAVLIDGAGAQDGSLSRLFGLDGRAGVSDILNGKSARDAVVTMAGVAIIPAGTIDGPSADLDGCRRIVASLADSYDIVIVATAPVTESAIATVWARATDGTILVAERDHSKRADVALAAESLALVERPLIGVVLAERGRSLVGRLERPAIFEPAASPPANAWPAPTGASSMPGPSRMASPMATPMATRMPAATSPTPAPTPVPSWLSEQVDTPEPDDPPGPADTPERAFRLARADAVPTVDAFEPVGPSAEAVASPSAEPPEKPSKPKTRRKAPAGTSPRRQARRVKPASPDPPAD